ncbi:MAG: DNA repair exonuclease [Tissierellia bacterium]|nr:DNA repair exonuclease [Tissierellia bacterium]
MEKIRIAHLSDLHLGSKSQLFDMESEMLKTLIDIINLCNSVKVDIILIAGDFFESSNIKNELKGQIKEIFNIFNGKIFISPGNHDFFSLDSPYNEEWSKNTYIFKKPNIEFVEIKELNTRIYGFAFDRAIIRERKLVNFPVVDSKYINIGIFHGDIYGTNEYNPIFPQDIENSKLDYMALGHIHKRSDILIQGNTRYAYSGNPFGRGFDETGSKGIYLGDISKNNIKLNFYQASKIKFLKEEIMVDEAFSLSDISRIIRKNLEAKYGEEYRNNLYDIKLKGYLNENISISENLILSELGDIRFVKIKNDTRINYDYDKLSREYSIRGIFVKNMLDKLVENKEFNEKVLEVGLRSFED